MSRDGEGALLGDGTADGETEEAPFLNTVEGPPSAQGRLCVSVVVPTCGRLELLDKCLSALLAQRIHPCAFEVLVVDDTPGEDGGAVRELVARHASGPPQEPTAALLTDHDAPHEQNTRPDATVAPPAQSREPHRPRIGYVRSGAPHGPATARNRGWRSARADIIAFTDDDTEPAPDWLANGLRAFDSDGEHVDVVCGRVLMPLPEQPTDYERDANRLESGEFVTANCFCRRGVLQQLGGFDERFRLAWREDSDLHFRLLELPARIVRAPHAVVVHPVRPAPWGVSVLQQKKIVFDALLFKKHRALYRQRIRATPRWDYYAIVAALLAMPVAAVLATPGWTAVAAAAWLGMTARFCVERLRGTSKAPRHVVEVIATSLVIPPLAVFWRVVGALRFRVAFV
jgi:GT2 family glycosyltransferase